MATITEFNDWLDQVDLDSEGYLSVYALYRSVKDVTSMGEFECKKHATLDQWFVKSHGVEDSLRLASESARDYFLLHLTKTHCGELEMEGWYSYNHGMSKDD